LFAVQLAGPEHDVELARVERVARGHGDRPADTLLRWIGQVGCGEVIAGEVPSGTDRDWSTRIPVIARRQSRSISRPPKPKQRKLSRVRVVGAVPPDRESVLTGRRIGTACAERVAAAADEEHNR